MPRPTRLAAHTLTRSLSRARTGLASLCLLLTLLTAGCSSQHGEVTLKTLDTPQTLTLDFPQAYCQQTPDGDWTFILLDDGLPRDPAGQDDHNQPLQPAARPAVQQIVHIRVLWRPLRGSRPDFPAATNASIDWYVIDQTSAPRAATGTPADMLRYEGVGFVSVYPHGHGARIYIRNAQLSLSTRRGTLADPIRKATLTGSANATASPHRIQQILTDLPATDASSPANSPPTRRPVGP